MRISERVCVGDDEIEIKAIRAQGSGGQNVNKVSSAVHLRFDINASSLPEYYKQRLLTLRDRRISSEGVIVIKAQKFRTLEKNREEALARLKVLISSVAQTQKKRVATKPTWSSRRRRLDSKAKQGKRKVLRGRVKDYD